MLIPSVKCLTYLEYVKIWPLKPKFSNQDEGGTHLSNELVAEQHSKTSVHCAKRLNEFHQLNLCPMPAPKQLPLLSPSNNIRRQKNTYTRVKGEP